MSRRLENKIAIVTGGADGLGKAMCLKFAEEGATVIAADMREITYGFGDDTEDDLGSIEGYILDVSDGESCKSLFDFVMEKYGRIDVLVNNAGITRDALTRKMTDDQWDAVIAVDLTRYVGPQMEVQGAGSIISISSVVGEFGNIGQANYAAAKSGVIGLTKSWAKEFARKGAQVRVNAIAPGYTMTAMLETVPQDLLDKFAGQTMLGRLGQPEEIANAALFLSSDEASYITGQLLSVNGGMRL